MTRLIGVLAAVCMGCGLAGCGCGGTAAAPGGSPQSAALSAQSAALSAQSAALSAQAALGQHVFNDTSLSSSGGQDELTFHVQRDIHPEKFYARNADGSVDQFDDLPPAHKTNVNTAEAPCDRGAGGSPALSDAEIDDVIAFLQT